MVSRLVFAAIVGCGCVLAILAFPRPCPGDPGAHACMPGTYLVEQDDGTQSVWTLSRDGEVHITSSAEAALQFSHEQGVWKQSGARIAKVTTLDFSFGPPVNGEEPPLAIARVDARLTFFDACHRVAGSFELRFFDPQSEDALDPSTDTGEPLIGMFTGRRLTTDGEVSHE